MQSLEGIQEPCIFLCFSSLMMFDEHVYLPQLVRHISAWWRAWDLNSLMAMALHSVHQEMAQVLCDERLGPNRTSSAGCKGTSLEMP